MVKDFLIEQSTMKSSRYIEIEIIIIQTFSKKVLAPHSQINEKNIIKIGNSSCNCWERWRGEMQERNSYYRRIAKVGTSYVFESYKLLKFYNDLL